MIEKVKKWIKKRQDAIVVDRYLDGPSNRRIPSCARNMWNTRDEYLWHDWHCELAERGRREKIRRKA